MDTDALTLNNINNSMVAASNSDIDSDVDRGSLFAVSPFNSDVDEVSTDDSVIRCTGEDAVSCTKGLCCILNRYIMSPLGSSTHSPARCSGSDVKTCDRGVCCFIAGAQLTPLPPITPSPVRPCMSPLHPVTSPQHASSASSNASTVLYSPIDPPSHSFNQCPLSNGIDCYMCNIMLERAINKMP